MPGDQIKISRQALNSMAKQAFINELSKRNIRGGYGKGDILIEGKLRGKVHAKQGSIWPNLKGPLGRDFLVLVDFRASADNPTFYILNFQDWKDFIADDLKDRVAKGDIEIELPWYGELWGRCWLR